ncbi:hypothetical protein K432DRAFT_430580 [Lepidopterella palustris CBS 459.81]|uniref:BTB domain-containing protein n=1 Tax=Lepidopterella palustris CBS 459.81 TaxID=1314670 RepID=A0A8E2DXJ0_9PEZI|nr:hypothetical protein K432DRAFT_430580 [Lepidopterella palustris CBS 459.81]
MAGNNVPQANAPGEFSLPGQPATQPSSSTLTLGQPAPRAQPSSSIFGSSQSTAPAQRSSTPSTFGSSQPVASEQPSAETPSEPQTITASPATTLPELHKITCDPNGDVVLVLKPNTRIQVNSKILSLASAPLKALLEGKFKEGRELYAAASRSECYELPLPDDDADAVELLCNILHCRAAFIPDAETVTVSILYGLALICDKYICYSAVAFHASIWIKPFENGMIVMPGNEAVLVVAFLLDLPKAFQKLSNDLILHWTGSFLEFQSKGDPNGVLPVRTFLELDKRRTFAAELVFETISAMTYNPRLKNAALLWDPPSDPPSTAKNPPTTSLFSPIGTANTTNNPPTFSGFGNPNPPAGSSTFGKTTPLRTTISPKHSCTSDANLFGTCTNAANLALRLAAIQKELASLGLWPIPIHKQSIWWILDKLKLFDEDKALTSFLGFGQTDKFKCALCYGHSLRLDIATLKNKILTSPRLGGLCLDCVLAGGKCDGDCRVQHA